MKIHPNIPNAYRKMPCGHPVLQRLLAICGLAAISVMAGTTANAQSGLFGGATARTTGTARTTQSNSTAPVQNGLFALGDENFQVVKAAAYKTAADIGETVPGSIAQVSCQSCQTNSCGGSCRGTGRAYPNNAIGYPVGQPCAPCNPFWYVSIEGLYMERQGSNGFSASPDFRLNDFDFEWIPRITIGAVPDCVHGYEISFTGVSKWDRYGAASSAAGNLQTLLTASAPFSATDLSAFSNAELQTQTWTAEYWSVEANKTLVGYDVAKLLMGIRYIDYQERFNYFSQTATETGALRTGLDNQMLGAQVGMDLLYPICRNGYTDFRTRAGVFANFVDSDIRLFNAGNTPLINVQSDTDLAGVLEVGGGVRYQIGDMLSFRVGGELWYLSGLATVPDQVAISVSSRRDIQTNDDVLIAGATFGAELRY